MNQPFTILLATDLAVEQCDLLWKQNVDMDDWDYCFFFPPDTIREVEIERDVEVCIDHYWTTKKQMVKEWVCDDYSIERILDRLSISYRWYLVEWNGEKKALGVCYH